MTVTKKASIGVGKVYYSVIGANGAYGTVKELGDLIEVTVKDDMNTSSANAGDKVYLQTTEYGGTDLTFSIYNITPEAECDIYGNKKATKGGIISNSGHVVPYVAIMLEQNSKTESSAVVDYVTLFKGMLQKPELKGKTKEKGKTEFQALQIAGTFQDLDNGDYKYRVSSDDADFDATEWATIWGKTVPMPEVKKDVPKTA